MPPRTRQILLVASMLWLSWLVMMLVHEGGHVLGAMGTGGRVRRVVWHPAAVSRTDVRPNPNPLVEVWAGPLIGSVLPVGLAGLASAGRMRWAYLLWVVAGFCLIANGAYIGIGAFSPVGDAQELIDHGMPRWPMVLFGAAAVASGLWTWHRVSPRLGFGESPSPICPTHVYTSLGVAVLMTAAGFAFGDQGV